MHRPILHTNRRTRYIIRVTTAALRPTGARRGLSFHNSYTEPEPVSVSVPACAVNIQFRNSPSFHLIKKALPVLIVGPAGRLPAKYCPSKAAASAAGPWPGVMPRSSSANPSKAGAHGFPPFFVLLLFLCFVLLLFSPISFDCILNERAASCPVRWGARLY